MTAEAPEWWGVRVAHRSNGDISETWTCTANQDGDEVVSAYERVARSMAASARRGNQVWLLRRVGDGPVDCLSHGATGTAPAQAGR